jgi:hypothetical protein
MIMLYKNFNIQLKVTFLLLFFSALCHVSLVSQDISESTVREYLGKTKKPRTFGKKIAVSKEMEEEVLQSFIKEYELNPVNKTSAQMLSTVETLPAGSLIIAMDYDLQEGSDDRVRKAYGLAVRLLHAGVPLKWIIDPNKGGFNWIDFSVTARKKYPTTGSYGVRNFTNGPIAIYPGYEAQAASVISSYGNDIRVYEIQNATPANINSNLTHKPVVFVEVSENPGIHTSILDAAGLSSGVHYNTGHLTSMTADMCVTIITVPHNGTITDDQRNVVKAFTRSGGNFFAQCAAIRGFQSPTNGTAVFGGSGFRDNPALGSFIYSNPPEPSAQFLGDIVNQGGAVVAFGFNSEPAGGTRIVHDSDNDFKAYTGRIDGVTTSDGGYVHYLAGHNHAGDIDADRYYLNAVIRSAIRPSNCKLSVITCTTPTIGTILGPSQVCMQLNDTRAVWAITGQTGTPMWQYSVDNVNWVDWGEGPSSPGGSVNNNPFYIRVRLTTGPTCVAYTPTLTVTNISPPAISVNSASICAGQSATLSVSNFNSDLGNKNLSRFEFGVDPRGSIGVVSGDIQLTTNVSYMLASTTLPLPRQAITVALWIIISIVPHKIFQLLNQYPSIMEVLIHHDMK